MVTLPEFDELNNIRTELAPVTAEIVESLATTPNGGKARKRCEDMIFELITMGYVYGLEVAGLSLDEDIPVNSRRMNEVALTPIDGETFRDRIDKHIAAAREALTTKTPEEVAETLNEELAVVAETETHRTGNAAVIDGGDWVEAETGKKSYKRWNTMQDDKVRDPHWLLEGAEVPRDAYFYVDGAKALYPGGFGRADLDVNCRCWTTLIPIE